MTTFHKICIGQIRYPPVRFEFHIDKEDKLHYNLKYEVQLHFWHVYMKFDAKRQIRFYELQLRLWKV